jgi:SAM-dependent methyltransferase
MQILAAKQFAKSVLPEAIRSRWSEWRVSNTVRRTANKNRTRSAKDVFDEIYLKNKWGGDPGESFSGTGSVGISAEQYIATINQFIVANEINSVLDIGCGDFRIGKEIRCDWYIGIDVAPSVIASNELKYGNVSRTFVCLDAAGPEPLPDAQLCLVRQVLQHLSNEQISAIVEKLSKFRYVIVTEHQPADQDFALANADKVHGPFTRLFSGSGVYLEQPPFNLDLELLLEASSPSPVGDVHSRGYIRTFLIKN